MTAEFNLTATDDAAICAIPEYMMFSTTRPSPSCLGRSVDRIDEIPANRIAVLSWNTDSPVKAIFGSAT